MRWPLIRTLPAKTNFHFVGFARIAGMLSILAVIGSLALCFTRGLNLGIDFKGGTSMELSTAPAPVDLAAVRSTLGQLHIGDVQVQSIGAQSGGVQGDVLVRFQTPTGADPNVTAARVKTALARSIPGVRFSSTQVVGPKVSGELFRNGVLALGIAIGLMLLYIWFRFELQFGLGAVVGPVPRRDPVVRPVRRCCGFEFSADHRRGHPDDHRLFDERHGGGVRPAAGEPAQVPAHAAAGGDRACRSTRPCRGR